MQIGVQRSETWTQLDPLKRVTDMNNEVQVKDEVQSADSKLFFISFCFASRDTLISYKNDSKSISCRRNYFYFVHLTFSSFPFKEFINKVNTKKKRKRKKSWCNLTCNLLFQLHCHILTYFRVTVIKNRSSMQFQVYYNK